jgi:hypothetical protein
MKYLGQDYTKNHPVSRSDFCNEIWNVWLISVLYNDPA